jgi:hypothetical protein
LDKGGKGRWIYVISRTHTHTTLPTHHPIIFARQGAGKGDDNVILRYRERERERERERKRERERIDDRPYGDMSVIYKERWENFTKTFVSESARGGHICCYLTIAHVTNKTTMKMMMITIK